MVGFSFSRDYFKRIFLTPLTFVRFIVERDIIKITHY
jgi:hypothetical protein